MSKAKMRGAGRGVRGIIPSSNRFLIRIINVTLHLYLNREARPELRLCHRHIPYCYQAGRIIILNLHIKQSLKSFDDWCHSTVADRLVVCRGSQYVLPADWPLAGCSVEPVVERWDGHIVHWPRPRARTAHPRAFGISGRRAALHVP